MGIPSGGPASLSDLELIIRGTSTSQVSMDDSDIRSFLGISSGQIGLSSALGKPPAGSASYGGPGSYTFVTPTYQYLTADIYGGGGGGGGGDNHNGPCGNSGYPGNPGGATYFYAPSTVYAQEGGGGAGNGQGGPGYQGGGSGGSVYTGAAGNGGAGGPPQQGGAWGNPGGSGGRTVMTWAHLVTAGNPAWGQGITVSVGGGGSNNSPAGAGGAGSAYISWS